MLEANTAHPRSAAIHSLDKEPEPGVEQAADESTRNPHGTRLQRFFYPRPRTWLRRARPSSVFAQLRNGVKRRARHFFTFRRACFTGYASPGNDRREPRRATIRSSLTRLDITPARPRHGACVEVTCGALDEVFISSSLYVYLCYLRWICT